MTEPRRDEDLSAALSGLAAGPDDTEAALAGLRPRFEQARRRHRVVVAGASGLGALVIAGAAVGLSLGLGNDGGVDTTPPASKPDRTTTSTTTTTTVPALPPPTTTPDATPPSSTPPATVDDHGGDEGDDGNSGPGGRSDDSGGGSDDSGPG
jgi:hypothetical protein